MELRSRKSLPPTFSKQIELLLVNRRIFAVGLLSVFVFALAAHSLRAEDSVWIYPQSKLQCKAGPEGENAAWPSESIDARSTDDSIEKVVAYYVKHSGFESPNWEILGREFPRQTKLPVGFWIGPGKTKSSAARVSITHHLRSDVATSNSSWLPSLATSHQSP